MTNETTDYSSQDNQVYLQLMTQEFTHFYNTKYSKVHQFQSPIPEKYMLTHQIQCENGEIHTQDELQSDKLIINAYLPIQEHSYSLCDDPTNPYFYINEVHPTYPAEVIELPHPGLMIRPVSPWMIQGLTPSGFHVVQRAAEQASYYAQFERGLGVVWALYCQILINAMRRAHVAYQQITEASRLLREDNVNYFQMLIDQPDCLTVEALDLDLRGKSLDEVYFSNQLNNYNRGNSIQRLPRASQLGVSDIIDFDELEYIEDFFPEQFHSQFDGYRDKTEYGITILTGQNYKIYVKQVARRYTCYETLLMLHKICIKEPLNTNKQSQNNLIDTQQQQPQQSVVKDRQQVISLDQQDDIGDMEKGENNDSIKISKMSLSTYKSSQKCTKQLDDQTESLIISNVGHENVSELSTTDLRGNRLKYLNHGWEDEKGECRVCRKSYKSLFHHIKTETHIQNYQAALDGPLNPAEKYIQLNPLTCRQFINGYGSHMSKRVQLEAMLQGLSADIAHNLQIPIQLTADAITHASYKRGIPIKIAAGNYARSSSPTLKTLEMVTFLQQTREKTADKIEKSCANIPSDAIETYANHFAQLLSFGSNYYKINKHKMYQHLLLEERNHDVKQQIQTMEDGDCFYIQQLITDYVKQFGYQNIKAFIQRVNGMSTTKDKTVKFNRTIIIFKQEQIDKGFKNFEIGIFDDLILQLAMFMQNCLNNIANNKNGIEEIPYELISTPKLPPFIQFDFKYYTFLKQINNNKPADSQDKQFIDFIKKLIYLNEQYACLNAGNVDLKTLDDLGSFEVNNQQYEEEYDYDADFLRSKSLSNIQNYNSYKLQATTPRANSVSTAQVHLDEDQISMRLLRCQYGTENDEKSNAQTVQYKYPSSRQNDEFKEKIRGRSRFDHLADALDAGLIVQSNNQFGISAMDAALLYLDAVNILYGGFNDIKYRYIMHYID